MLLDQSADIERHVLDFYTELFASENECIDNGLIEESIDSMGTMEDNEMLTKLPTWYEVEDAVFGMNFDGAPGPDGFGGFFYQKYWDIVGKEVYNVVTQFFKDSWLPQNINSNNVVLIPKTTSADAINQFRPIALANYKFKIITKVLADRLGRIAPKIVSQNQRGFIKDRSISDCTCVASVAVNLLDKRCFGGNVALKIDIEKAFDTMDWGFLLEVLSSFGFDPVFCNWIKIILHSTKLSISVNGHSVGFFPCKRGVRQGDPFSPLLFCLVEDVLSRSISKLVDQGELLPITSPRVYKVPSHVLYVDDILIFCRGTKRNLECLMSLFKRYSEASGQHVSCEKSKVYSGGIPHNRLQNIIDIVGFGIGHLPFMYLGVPLFRGKPRKVFLQPIADKIKAKLATWKGLLLSIMGRVQLVKSVIHSMLIYSFHVYSWPVSLLNLIDKWKRNFIWSGNVNVRKIVTVSWFTMCSPIEEGGLGLKSIKGINKASMLKLCWQLVSSNKQWAVLLKARALVNNQPIQHHLTSSVWAGLKLYINTVLANCRWHVGDVCRIDFWKDRWLSAPIV